MSARAVVGGHSPVIGTLGVTSGTLPGSTCNTYAHLLPQSDELAADRIAAVLTT